MTNFKFNAASITDFNTGRNYYTWLVTSEPNATMTLRSQLVCTTSQVPLPLTGESLVGDVWSFSNFTIPAFNYTAPVTGLVIVEQLGGSPAASDKPIAFLKFQNTGLLDITVGPGALVIQFEFGINGAVKINNVYAYNSASYVPGGGGGVPFGLIHLFGTANNTTAFSNPAPSKFNLVGVNSFTSPTVLTPVTFPTDRTILDGPSTAAGGVAFDFGARRVRAGVIGIRWWNFSTTLTVYAAESLPANFNVSDFATIGNWSNIGTINVGVGGWYTLVPTDTTTFFRYFWFTAEFFLGTNFSEIEFYDSTVYSPTLNLT